MNIESDGEVVVAVKIVHTTRSQEVRFADRATAEQYAAQYGGLDAWRVLPISGGHLPDWRRTDSRDAHWR